jgi:hypothetical protein
MKIEENGKQSFSFKVFYFLCLPSMLWITLLSAVFGHGSSFYLIDKNGVDSGRQNNSNSTADDTRET